MTDGSSPPRITVIPDPFGNDARLFRKVKVSGKQYRVRFRKTGHRTYTAFGPWDIEGLPPDFRFDVAGSQPARVNWKDADTQLTLALCKALSSQDKDAIVMESPLPEHLRDMDQDSLVEAVFNDTHFWINFDARIVYAESDPSFIGNLDEIPLSQHALDRLRALLVDNVKDAYDESTVSAILKLFANHQRPIDMIPPGLVTTILEDEEAQESLDSIDIEVSGVGLIAIMGEHDGDKVTVTSPVLEGEWKASSEEESIELFRSAVKKLCGCHPEIDTTARVVKIHVSSIADKDGDDEVAFPCVVIEAAGGRFVGSAFVFNHYVYGPPTSSYDEALDKLVEEVAHDQLTHKMENNPTQESQDVSAVVEDTVQQPALEIVDTQPKESEYLDFDLPEVVVDPANRDAERVFVEHETLRVFTDDEPHPVFLSVTYEKRSGLVLEITAKSKFMFPLPLIENEEEGPKLDENGRMLLEPQAVPYSLAVNVDTKEGRTILDGMIFRGLSKEDVVQSLNKALSTIMSLAENVVADEAKRLAEQVVNMRAMVKIRELGKRAEAGDLDAQVELMDFVNKQRAAKGLPPKQMPMKAKQQVVQPVTEHQAKAEIAARKAAQDAVMAVRKDKPKRKPKVK